MNSYDYGDDYFDGLMGFGLGRLFRKKKKRRRKAKKMAKAAAIATEITTRASALGIPSDQLASLQAGLGWKGILNRLKSLQKMQAEQQFSQLEAGVAAMATGNPAAAAVIPQTAYQTYPYAPQPTQEWPQQMVAPMQPAPAYAPSPATYYPPAYQQAAMQPLPVGYGQPAQYPVPDEATIAVDASGNLMLAEQATYSGLAPVRMPAAAAAAYPAYSATPMPSEYVQQAVLPAAYGQAVAPSGMVIEEATAAEMAPGTEQDVARMALAMEEEGVPGEFAGPLAFDVLYGLGRLSEGEKQFVARRTADKLRARSGKRGSRRGFKRPEPAVVEALPPMTEEAPAEELLAVSEQDLLRLSSELQDEGVPAGFADTLALNLFTDMGLMTPAEEKAVSAKAAKTLLKGLAQAEARPWYKTGLGLALIAGGGYLGWRAATGKKLLPG